jgi:hypothetical protein
MPSTSPTRSAKALAAGLTVLLGLTLGAAGSTPPASAHHTGAAPGPVHAGNTFGWYGHGGLIYDETFVGPLASRWQVEGPGAVRNQHGMLTLNTTRKGSVSATLERRGQTTGRWETRLRSRVYGRGHADYVVLTELVPVRDDAERCGEQNIALNRYRLGTRALDFYIRTRPDHMYTAQIKRGLGQDQWHTFAVEVTPKRISWFVDAHVIRTETRPAALSGASFQVRFTMQARKGKRMNPARMQMDWLRYWSLKAPNEKSTAAPQTNHTTYKHACGPKA